MYTFLYSLDPVPDGDCTPDNTLEITVEQAPFAEYLGQGTVCNDANGTEPSTIDLNTLINATAGGNWTDTAGDDVTNMFDGDGETPGTVFTFTYTVGGTATCPPATVDVEVRVINCLCPDLNVDINKLCNGDNVIDLTAFLTNESGINGTWSWSGTTNPINGDMFDPAGIQSGPYTLTYTLDTEPNPGNNCDQEASAQWQVVNQPVIVLGNSDNPCDVDVDPADGDDVTIINLDDWVDTGSSSGTWTQSGGTPMLTINGDNTVDFDGQTIGDEFVFTYSVTAQDPCVDVMESITITVVSCNCPPISLSAPAPLCNDAGMVDLATLSNESDDGTFIVTGPDGNVTLTGTILDAQDLTSGDYTVTFSLNDQPMQPCPGSLSEDFRIEDYKTTGIANQAEVCNVDNGDGLEVLDLSTLVDDPINGTWTDTDGTGVDLTNPMSVSFIGVPFGTYTFTYTIDNVLPCEDFVTTIEITVIDCNCRPINPTDPGDECNTEGAVDLFQYNDPNRSGTWSTTETGITITDGRYLDLTQATAGTYDIVYTVDDPEPGCDPTKTRSITVFNQLSAGSPNDQSPREFCIGDSEVVTLRDMLDGQSQGGTWRNDSANQSGTFDAAGASFDVTTAEVGTYEFTYFFDNQSPCEDDEATVTVIIHDLPNADAGNDAVLDCDVTTTELGGNSTPLGEIEYKWRELGGIPVVPNDEATVEVDEAGTYELEVTNGAFCSDRDTTVVRVEDGVPQVRIDIIQPLCVGDVGSITITQLAGSSGNLVYEFDGQTGALNPSVEINNLTPGQAYDFTVTNTDNNCERSLTESIDPVEEVIVEVPVPVLIGEIGSEFELTFNSQDFNADDMVVWTNEAGDILCEGNLASCDTLLVSPNESPTLYFVSVTTVDGCTDNDQIEVRLEEEVDVDFPNIISPLSADGNTVFYIQSDFVSNVRQLVIFDRWGNKVFDVENVAPNDPDQGWDGKFNGKDVVPGVYTFLVELDLQTSTGAPAGELVETGDVTVMK